VACSHTEISAGGASLAQNHCLPWISPEQTMLSTSVGTAAKSGQKLVSAIFTPNELFDERTDWEPVLAAGQASLPRT
jgi:hypothetical protein